MKKLTLALVAAMMTLLAVAQPAVKIVPQLKLGDTFSYFYKGMMMSNLSKQVMGDSPHEAFTKNFTVKVLKSVPEGWQLEYRIQDFSITNDKSEVPNDSIEQLYESLGLDAAQLEQLGRIAIDGVGSFLTTIKSEPILFTVTHKGNFVRFDNMKAVNKAYIKTMKPFMHSLINIMAPIFKEKKDDIEKKMNEEIEKDVLPTGESDDIVKSLFPEIQYLFAYQGIELKAGQWAKTDSVKTLFNLVQNADRSIDLTAETNLWDDQDVDTEAMDNLDEEAEDSLFSDEELLVDTVYIDDVLEDDSVSIQNDSTQVEVDEDAMTTGDGEAIPEDPDFAGDADWKEQFSSIQKLEFHYAPDGIVETFKFSLDIRLESWVEKTSYTVTRLK